MPRAFELQVLHAEHWTIDTIFRDRETALRSARELHAASPLTPVRVIDESFDPETGRGASAVIYRAPRETSDVAERPLTRSSTRTPSHPKPPAARPKKPSLVTTVVTLTLALGGAGLALVAVLAWVSGFVRL